MFFRSISLVVFALLASSNTAAHEYSAGELRIQNPYARATVPGQPSGGAYLSAENTGKNSDSLISVSSPVAKAVEMHTMSMDGGMMKMREVPRIELKPSAKLAMKPGDGYHLMLIGLKRQLKAGDKFPLTLNFEKAGKIEVSVQVEERDAKASSEAGMHGGH